MIHKKFSWEIAGAVIVVDQLSKFLTEKYFAHGVHHNSGLPFSINLPTAPLANQRFFYLLIISAALLVFIWAARNFFSENAAASALIIGGAISNLADRAALGYVRDFIPAVTGTTNPADIAVFLGMIVLLWNIKFHNL